MNNPPPLLLHVYSTFKVGGPQVRFVQLANHFGSRYRHLVVAMDGVTDAMAGLSADVDASVLDVPIRRGDTLANVRSFRRVLRERRPNLLVTSNWGSIEWAMANLGGLVRHVHMEDGFGPDEATRQIPRRVWMRRLLLRRATVVLPSLTLYDIARNVWRLPRKNLIRVANGIDASRFRPAAPQSTGAIERAEEPVIGTIAALRTEKNLSRLIDAFARVVRLRPARLVVVGDGAEMPKLQEQASALGVADRVVFAGHSSQPEKFLADFSIFALSSDTEQMPISVLEAMAAGLPLAATNVGDVRHMLAPENSPFVVEKDAQALADALLVLLADPVRAKAIGTANARRVGESYEQAIMFSAWRNLFDGTPPEHSAIWSGVRQM